MNRRLREISWVVLLLGVMVQISQAGLDIRTGGLSGNEGYRESSFGVEAGWPWKPKDSNAGQTVTHVSLSYDQTRYAHDNVQDATRRALGGSMEFFGHGALDLSLWALPAPDGGSRSYEAKGVSGGISLWGPGWLPDPRPGAAHFMESELRLFWDRTSHRQTFIAAGQPQELTINEWAGGFRFAETFPSKTQLSVTAERHHYNRDLQALSRRLEFLTLLNTDTAGSIELLEGFVSKAWGMGVAQDIGRWARVSFDWRRAEYALGRSPRSDTFQARLTGYFGKFFSAYLSREVFQPHDNPVTRYTGFGLGLNF